MILKKGDLCKHFKGKNLQEKNIYEVLETGVNYSGDASENPIKDLVIYKNIRQGKIFAREMSDLVAELTPEKQQEFGQKHRVDLLTKEEIEVVKSMIENQER
jgi:hypothetical protein